jgi:hypothetical protein
VSFLAILKKIGGVSIVVEHVAAPVAELVFPEFSTEIVSFDGLITRLQASMAKSEENAPSGTGAVKKQLVVNDIQMFLAAVNQTLAPAGVAASFGNAELAEAIDAFVAAYNAAAKLKMSVAIAKTSP